MWARLQEANIAAAGGPSAALEWTDAEGQEPQQAAAEAASVANGWTYAEQQEAQQAAAQAADSGSADQNGPSTAEGSAEIGLMDKAAGRGCRRGNLGDGAGETLQGFSGLRDLSGWYVAAPGWGLAALLLLRAGWGAAH